MMATLTDSSGSLGGNPTPGPVKNRPRKRRQPNVVVNFMILTHPPISPTELELNLDLDQTKIKNLASFPCSLTGLSITVNM